MMNYRFERRLCSISQHSVDTITLISCAVYILQQRSSSVKHHQGYAFPHRFVEILRQFFCANFQPNPQETLLTFEQHSFPIVFAV